MALDPVTAGLNLFGKAIDKIFPDKAKADEVKLQMAKLSIDGNLDEMKIGMSAIIAEAKSQDKWTSRARPSFLYVMYILILFSIPMGIVSIWWPSAVNTVSKGMKLYLAAIPDEMWSLFKYGFLGYVGGRSFDKFKNIGKV